jgi:hypothetical protein
LLASAQTVVDGGDVAIAPVPTLLESLPADTPGALSETASSRMTVLRQASDVDDNSQFDDGLEEEVVSVFDVSDEPSTARTIAPAPALLGDLEQNAGGDASASWEVDTGPWSSVSSTRTSIRPLSGRPMSPPGLAEATEMALLNGSLNSMLRRLTQESQYLDESLTRSMRRVLQLGTVLQGRGLSEEEIKALPKVRFESAERQHCSICLEAYKEGELLTALHCSHFFHIDCLSRWMQRATLCPLCRTPCCPEQS